MISPRYFREIPQRYRLEAGRCKKCGIVYFPPRQYCGECKSKEFETVKLSDTGKLLTYTIIRIAPSNFSKETPYAVGIIELNDSVKLTAQITDADLNNLEIGQNVKLVFRKIQDEGKSGLHCYGYKAVVI
ncbi:MAG TPA: Zn-ribbon domain-containing OB-fold protein [Ignavibacteriaceae bacterium]|nr:Zn-ribbon domain-containing OB-fold protein [Ignavibacteriaceae bacterium]